MRGFLLTTLVVFVPALLPVGANAGVPDPANSFVAPWDDYGRAVVSPGSGGDSLIVLVRDASGAFCAGYSVEIDFSDCTTLCKDCPSGLRATTNYIGLAVLDPRVTGCESCNVIIRAGGVVLRTYTRVVTPDWNGVLHDGRVDTSDLAYFVTVYPSSPAADDCMDFTGDGVIDDDDYDVFSACYLSQADYPCFPPGPCEITPPCLEFSTVEVGDWEERSFRIRNVSGSTLVDSVTSDCPDFTVEAGGGPYSLEHLEWLDVTIRFAPTVAGSLTCTVDAGGTLCGDYFCVGYADYPPVCEVSPFTLAFDSVMVGSWRERTFTIRNGGGGVLADSVVAVCPQYTITDGAGPYALTAGDSIVVTVRFAPDAAGTWPCDIYTGSCPDVSCEGVAYDPPVCEVAPLTLAFDTLAVGTWRDETFTIRNSGGGVLADSVVAACPQYTITDGGGPYALAAGDSLVVTVRFAPDAAGAWPCDIHTGSCPDVSCEGFAIDPPVCQVSPYTLVFDTVVVGNWREETFTIRNSGGGVLADSVVAVCPQYTITDGGGPYALAAGDSLVVTVRFEPDAAGAWPCDIYTGFCPDVSCEGVGVNPPPGPVEPRILSIQDIGNDQGRYVRVKWMPCAYDAPEDTVTVTGYALYRRQDLYLKHDPSADTGGSGLAFPARASLAGWDYIDTVPARGDTLYQIVAPTLCDSTLSAGMCWSVFLVSALSPDPLVYWDSEPDSGYSIDNLAPGVPEGISVAYNTGTGNQITWEPCGDADFDYFCIYRGTDGDFVPGPENLVDMATEPAWTDPSVDGPTVRYKVTAVDFSGNESDPGSPDRVTGIADASFPQSFALHQNVPNPFNPITTIRFDVPPGGGLVTLRVYDARGRLVRTLVNGTQTTGQKQVNWDAVDDRGQAVASGVYFYRMTAPGYELTRKMVVLK